MVRPRDLPTTLTGLAGTEYMPADQTSGALGKITLANARKFFGHVLNLYDYGAKGDATTDDTAAIQSAYTAAGNAGGGVVFVPEGTFIANGLTIPANVFTVGAGWGSILKQPAGVADNAHLLSAFGSGTTVAGNVVGIGIHNLQLVGRSDVDTFTQHVHLIALCGVSDVDISGVKFTAWRGDGVYIGSLSAPGVAAERHNERIIIDRCHFDGVNKNNRNGVSVTEGTDVAVIRNFFTRCTAASMPGGVDIEPNNFTYTRLRNVEIAHNDFDGIGGAVANIVYVVPTTQATLTVPSQHINIHHNRVRNYTGLGGAVYCIHTQTPGNATVRNDITIADNDVDGSTTYPLEIDGVRGVRIERNRFGTSPNTLNIGWRYGCKDVLLEGNEFVGTSTTDGIAISVFTVDRLRIERNVFDTIGLANGTYGVLVGFRAGFSGASTSSAVDFLANRVVGTTANAISSKSASHTLSAATNKFDGNDTTLAPDLSHWTQTFDTVTGRLTFGDVNLYREAANVWRTDDSFRISVGNALELLMASGTGSVSGDSSNRLNIQGGSGGARFINAAFSAVNLTIADAGTLTLRSGVLIASGAGSPESVVTAPAGSLYLRTDGGAGTGMYVKESGAGNTGWIAK